MLDEIFFPNHFILKKHNFKLLVYEVDQCQMDHIAKLEIRYETDSTYECRQRFQTLLYISVFNSYKLVLNCFWEQLAVKLCMINFLLFEWGMINTLQIMNANNELQAPDHTNHGHKK